VRRLLVVLLAVLVVFSPAAPASAHGSGGSTDYRVEFTTVTGSLDGVELRIRALGERLEITRTTASEVFVLGYEGEPYLRLDAEGVWRNAASPATYLNENRYAQVALPATADAKAAPRWDHLATGNTVAWHDHRAHWMSPTAPPITSSEPDVEHVVYEDSVQLRIDGRDVSVGTRITWVPTPATTWWLAAAGGLGAAMVGLALWRRRAAAVLAATAALTSLVTRPAGPVWLVLPLIAVVLAAIGLVRRDARVTAAAALAAVVTASLRLDAVQRALLPGSLSPTLQRIAVVATLALGAGAIVGATSGTRRPAPGGLSGPRSSPSASG